MRLIREHQATLLASNVRDRSHALLDRIPGWRRLDDVALPGAYADHVVATPIGLLVVVTKWRARTGAAQDLTCLHERDLGDAATVARRVRRVVAQAPNAVDVPVCAVLLLFGPGDRGPGTGWDQTAGVYVLDGDRPWAWPSELISAMTGDPEHRLAEVDEALRKVHGRAGTREPRFGSQPTGGWRAVRA